MLRRIALSAVSIALATAAVAAPTITQIHDPVRPRSGRVVIEGTGFGTDGVVRIAGIASWVSSWADTRIVAFVPEQAALDAATLIVESAGQQSNAVSLQVTDRQQEGRVKWRFETDGDNLWWRPALAPDGTIYVHTNNDYDGLVYALTPDGGLKWIRKVNWYPYVPPTAGPDGAVYVGSIGSVYRISPEGNIDWEYRPDGVNVEVAPTIGPDGLLYGAFEVSGAFALEPTTGQVVWENPGEPLITDQAGEAVQAVFGPAGPGQPVDQFYVSVDGGGSFHAFDLDGDQLYTTGLGNLKGTAEAAIGSDGTIYGPRAIGLTVAAIDPSDGSLLWEYYPSDWATGTGNVEIGPDDTLYFVGSSAKLEAMDPSTQTRIWQVFDSGTCLNRPTLTPDGSKLLLNGSLCGQYGSPGFVRAHDPADGSLLWNVDLPFQTEPAGYRIYGTHHPRITPDGQTAYISTYSLIEWPLEGDHTFFYALDISDSGCAAPELGDLSHDADKATVRWDALGAGATYDVSRGDLDQLGGGAGPSCMADETAQTWYTDSATPPNGLAYYYLVRSTTECGTGSWGRDSSGNRRDGSCP